MPKVIRKSVRKILLRFAVRRPQRDHHRQRLRPSQFASPQSYARTLRVPPPRAGRRVR